MTKGSQVKKDPFYTSTEEMTEIWVKLLLNNRESSRENSFSYFPTTKGVFLGDHLEKQQRNHHEAAGNHVLSILLKELFIVYSEICQK